MAIVELDADGQSIRSGAVSARSTDRGLFAGLAVASAAFAIAVWLARPAATTASVETGRIDTSVPSALVIRGPGLQPLALPPFASNVDLGMLPDRLANEAAPIEWRRVITVRGIRGVASDEGVPFVSWSEKGILYWISSPTLTTEQLIQIADEMQ